VAQEGEDASGCSGRQAFAMELTLVVQALVERAAQADAVRDLDTMILQTQLALLEDPEWNRLAANASMRVSSEVKATRNRSSAMAGSSSSCAGAKPTSPVIGAIYLRVVLGILDKNNMNV
jgi:hypothetical protein